VDALEARLKTARERLQAVMERLPYSDPRAELDVAHAELLAAERALAAARGEEYAIPLEGLPPSDVGAPLPHLLADGRRVLLAYYVAEPDPNWDGTYVTMIARGHKVRLERTGMRSLLERLAGELVNHS
jgi:hypothetical protein